MNLKRALWIIMFANKIGMIFIVAALVFYVKMMVGVQYVVYTMVCFFIGSMFLLSKRIILKRAINKISYPGLLYGVCDRMGLLHNLNFYPDENILNDLHQPEHNTDHFLSRNNLSPVVYTSSVTYSTIAKGLNFLPLIIAGGAYIYGGASFLQPFLILLCFGYLIIILLANYLRRSVDKDSYIIYRFAPEGLEMPHRWIPWSSIYDWEFIRADKDGRARVVISLFNTLNGPKTEEMVLEDLAVVPTDLFLLLLHYKNKYGYAKNEEVIE